MCSLNTGYWLPSFPSLCISHSKPKLPRTTWTNHLCSDLYHKSLSGIEAKTRMQWNTLRGPGFTSNTSGNICRMRQACFTAKHIRKHNEEHSTVALFLRPSRCMGVKSTPVLCERSQFCGDLGHSEICKGSKPSAMPPSWATLYSQSPKSSVTMMAISALSWETHRLPRNHLLCGPPSTGNMIPKVSPMLIKGIDPHYFCQRHYIISFFYSFCPGQKAPYRAKSFLHEILVPLKSRNSKYLHPSPWIGLISNNISSNP